LKRGARVRVKQGPFEGLEGILVRSRGISQFVLSVEILNRAVALEIDAVEVEPIAPRRIGEPNSLLRNSKYSA
jgi:transcription antitermination factor NusG